MVRVCPHDPTSQVRPGDPNVVETCLIIGGGAWASCFFIGVMEEVQSKFSRAELSNWAFCGESAGCIIALALALDVPAAEVHEILREIAAAARSKPVGIAGCGTHICG